MAKKLYSTSIALPAPFVANSCDPVDARLIVESFTDITTNAGDTFGVISDIYCKVYEGMDVYVSSEKATYKYVGGSDANGILLTEVQKTANWRKVSTADNSVDAFEDFVDKVTAFSAATDARFDATDKVIEENELTTSSALNDLNRRIMEESASTANLETKVDNFSASMVTRFDAMDVTINNFSAATEARFDGLDTRIQKFSGATHNRFTSLADTVNTLSASTHNRIGSVSATLVADYTEKINVVTAQVSKAYHFCGSVATKANLPQSAKEGDVYNVQQADGTPGSTGYTPAGTNYAWNGTEWDALGGTVDLSAYATSANVHNTINSVRSSLSSSISGVDNRVTALSGATHNRLNTLDTEIDSVNTRVTNFSAATHTKFASYATSANVHNTIAAVNTRVTNLSGATNNRLNSLDGEISTVNGRVTTLSGATHNRLNSLNGSISTVDGRVTTLSAATNTRFGSYATSANTHNTIQSVNNKFASYATSANVHNTIAALKSSLDSLVSRVTALENADTGVDESEVQSIIRNYIKGTANEIKVTTASTSVTIGFDDNAIFGETEDYK